MTLEQSIFRITATIFVLSIIVLFLTKPKLFFTDEGQIKEFGVNFTNHTTPITLMMGTYGSLLFIYLLLTYISIKGNISYT